MKYKPWLYVALTSIFELLWVYGFNVADKAWHWALVLILILIDFYYLSKACLYLPTGTVYAIFAAAGTVGTALMDIFIFNHSFSAAKGFFIGVIVVGVILLNLSDNAGMKKIEIEGEGS
ncbi:ligand-binding protein SH3 [Ammoniphilus oxalaticus]|uniref:Ligand-binding protein SH3 n=1 Tax=Ammoniphilus oxalaticus TaxID=66863 RepID=A0A419SNK3_9BACL|nr:SMR family transporter [Ammoniphilus oxalaticus]RKD25876.1 ligand-binding protein SH3 [Ammoniphilus oxalaticus]